MSVDESLNVFMNTRTRPGPGGAGIQLHHGPDLPGPPPRRRQAHRPEGDYIPLIFDDSFVLYDEDRLHTALKWLKKAYPGQIIIFTCHQREAQMMTADQIAYHLVTM